MSRGGGVLKVAWEEGKLFTWEKGLSMGTGGGRNLYKLTTINELYQRQFSMWGNL